MLGGIFWRGATRTGAMAGLITGFAVWFYTMLLPSFGTGVLLSAEIFESGLFGWSWLRPQALFGITGIDCPVDSSERNEHSITGTDLSLDPVK